MFTFAADDVIHHPQPVPPALVIPALRETLQAIERRISIVGRQGEPRVAGQTNWSSEQHLIAKALQLSAGWSHWPTHNVWAPPSVVVHGQNGGPA